MRSPLFSVYTQHQELSQCLKEDIAPWGPGLCCTLARTGLVYITPHPSLRVTGCPLPALLRPTRVWEELVLGSCLAGWG